MWRYILKYKVTDTTSVVSDLGGGVQEINRSVGFKIIDIFFLGDMWPKAPRGLFHVCYKTS